MNAFKVNYGFPQFEKMENVDKLEVLFFFLHLVLVDNLEPNSITTNDIINLFITHVLASYFGQHRIAQPPC